MDERNIEKVISSLKNASTKEDVEIIKKASRELNELLKSDAAVESLKKNRAHFEVVLPLYVRIILHPDSDVADRMIDHRAKVAEIFESGLPGIKRDAWYKDFEANALLGHISSLKSRIIANDKSWATIWIWISNLVIQSTLQTQPLNKLLSMTEVAFKYGKDNTEICDGAWACWVALIDAFGRFPEILTPSRIPKLLLRPLQWCATVSKHRISTWVHLINVQGKVNNSSVSVKQLLSPFFAAMYMLEPADRNMSRHFPDECAEALIEVLKLDHVVQHCIQDVVGVFGYCVNSRPSGALIEQLATSIIKAINDTVDDGNSFKLWKALLVQYNSCTESPFLSQACQIIFSDVNFLRWVYSGTIDSKDIAELMCSSEFRNKVLLRSVKALNFVELDTTPSKRKARKGSCEVVWSNYCEAFISWWTNLTPPCPKEPEKAEPQNVKESSEYLAVQFLLIQPIRFHMWNPAVSKTWARLCEASHNQKLLHTFVKVIFEAVDEADFHVQKAIHVADCLFKIDDSFCKFSTSLLENISSAIKSMEFQNLLDVLNLLETAVLHPEIALVISKICKNANEKCSDYDQLNSHKIRTKVGKILRKLENISSAEKEKPSKTQRTPFRTQSNFLQRLAKAEEKSRTKSPFLTSILSSAENAKNGVETGDGQLDDSLDISLDSSVIDDGKKPVSQVEDSEAVPIITLPSVLRSPSVKENVGGGMVAEKENVVLPSVPASPPVSSPRVKITNAREVKTVDTLSPTVAKKPKPIAGQKSTPKKITPSIVSYFDDDANDCVMVPPKPKTTPLTEHQMEIMSKRRTDIPALYQDLSQDTQASQPSAGIQEVTTGVPPQPIPESQDIVPGTPSPKDSGGALTPERPIPSEKSSSSAKKLDFNGMSTPPSKITLLSSNFQKLAPVPEQVVQKQLIPDNVGDVTPLNNGFSGPDEQRIDSHEMTPKMSSQTVNSEKSRKKRKSEPSKFSPKLTRSKKNLKSATPDPKKSTVPESDSQLPRPKSPDHVDLVVESANSKGSSDAPDIGSLPDPLEKKDERNAEEKSVTLKDNSSTGTQESQEPSSQLDREVISRNTPQASEPASQGKSKKSRKRKAEESNSEDTKKNQDDDTPSAKKSNTSKKKKPFKLGAGGNLESWLVKTDRIPAQSEMKIDLTETPDNVPTPPTESIGKADSVGVQPERSNDEVIVKQEPGSDHPVVDLNNSDEIVPSTQEVVESPKSTAKSVLRIFKSEAAVEGYDVLMQIEVDPSKECNGSDPTPKSEGSVLDRLAHESPNDDIDLVISPSKRQRRASSVFRDEGDTYLLKDKFNSTTPEEEMNSPVRSMNKSTSPTSKKKLQPVGGRSARMLRLATGTSTSDENVGIVTPIRRRESIAPVKYGENWPKGHMEDWVACAPTSPYASPFRSALKKTPVSEEHMTPKRTHDSLASPLLSSAKRKRVVFLDPPVTRGLLYDVGTPSGSVHHADVPPGSPYPTWKGDNDLQDDVRADSPSLKRDAERLNSVGLKTQGDNQEVTSPTKDHNDVMKSKPDQAHPDVSEEVRRLLDPSEPTITDPEPDMGEFREKFHLTEDFMAQLTNLDAHIRSLLMLCFESTDMAGTVDAWKFGDCRRICQLDYSFLKLVKNASGQSLTEILSSSVFTAPTDLVPPVFVESSAQTEQLKVTSTQTNTPASKNTSSQTSSLQTRSTETNTQTTATSSSSTQADLKLPSVEDLTPLLKKVGPQQALLFFSDSLRILSSLSEEN